MIKIRYKHKKADKPFELLSTKKIGKSKKFINGNPDLPERLNSLFLERCKEYLIPFHG
jgi:hypothetical protein